MHANFSSRQTNININFWVVGDGGGRKHSDFWAAASNVTLLAFTTPCLAAILLSPLFCNICATKAKSRRFIRQVRPYIVLTQLVLTAFNDAQKILIYEFGHRSPLITFFLQSTAVGQIGESGVVAV